MARRLCSSWQSSPRPIWSSRRLTTSSAAIFSATNSTVLPSCTAAAIRLAMVCDLPVPGGPWIRRLWPARAAAIALACEASASRTWSVSRGGSSSSSEPAVERDLGVGSKALAQQRAQQRPLLERASRPARPPGRGRGTSGAGRTRTGRARCRRRARGSAPRRARPRRPAGSRRPARGARSDRSPAGQARSRGAASRPARGWSRSPRRRTRGGNARPRSRARDAPEPGSSGAWQGCCAVAVSYHSRKPSAR